MSVIEEEGCNVWKSRRVDCADRCAQTAKYV